MILFFYYSSVIIHLYSSAAWWYYRESLQYRRRFEFWSWLLNTFLLIFYLRSINQMWISWKSLWHIAKLQCLIYIAVYSSIHPFLFIIAIFPASLQGYLPLIISLPLFICSSSLEKMVCLYPSYLAWQYLPVCGVKKLIEGSLTSAWNAVGHSSEEILFVLVYPTYYGECLILLRTSSGLYPGALPIFVLFPLHLSAVVA